jgi:hypothetical protein
MKRRQYLVTEVLTGWRREFATHLPLGGSPSVPRRTLQALLAVRFAPIRDITGS